MEILLSSVSAIVTHNLWAQQQNVRKSIVV